MSYPFYVASLCLVHIHVSCIILQDKIRRSISENGGIDVILKIVDDSGDGRGAHNSAVARVCCFLLFKVSTIAFFLFQFNLTT